MSEFLAALLALISSYMLPAQPDSVPPVNKDQYIKRGSAVSQLAKSLNPDHDENESIPGNSSQNFSFQENLDLENRGNNLGFRRLFGLLGVTGVTQNQQISSEDQSGPTGITEETGPTSPAGQFSHTGPTGPDTDRVPAQNINSRITIPNDLPGVVLPHSRALEEFSGEFPKPPGLE